MQSTAGATGTRPRPDSPCHSLGGRRRLICTSAPSASERAVKTRDRDRGRGRGRPRDAGARRAAGTRELNSAKIPLWSLPRVIVSSVRVSSSGDGSPANAGYLAFHQPRFAFLLKVVSEQVVGAPRILDVGPSPFTAMLRATLHSPVDTLGLEPEATSERGRHFHFNLNDTQHGAKWRLDFGRYDLIVFAEVIEHLFTAPEIVLAYLRDLLVPGGQLVLQTPNAASLRKRIKLALGRNPFERIRLDPSNPGHFREYTATELAQILAHSGFAVRQSWTQFYFDARHARHLVGNEPPSRLRGTVVNIVNRALPAFLREGITILAARA